MKMNKAKTWMYGVRVIEKEKNFILEGLKKIIPEEVSLNKSSQFSRCYIWLWFYFNEIRKCERCGKLSCSKGLIRLMNYEKTKTLLYVCRDCGRQISEIKEKSRKYCHNCQKRTLMNDTPCGSTYKESENVKEEEKKKSERKENKKNSDYYKKPNKSKNKKRKFKDDK